MKKTRDSRYIKNKTLHGRKNMCTAVHVMSPHSERKRCSLSPFAKLSSFLSGAAAAGSNRTFPMKLRTATPAASSVPANCSSRANLAGSYTLRRTRCQSLAVDTVDTVDTVEHSGPHRGHRFSSNSACAVSGSHVCTVGTAGVVFGRCASEHCQAAPLNTACSNTAHRLKYTAVAPQS